jgi:hypothetical protein
MTSDTLTLTLLDREVVLTDVTGDGYWLSDDGAVFVSRWGDTGTMTAGLGGIDLRGEGSAESQEEAIKLAVADLDHKLRRLREWMR